MSTPLRLVSMREEVAPEPSVALVVVETPRIRRTVSRVLRAMGMELVTCDSLSAGERWIESSTPSLLIYDLDMAGDGTDLARISSLPDRPELVLLSERRDLPWLKELSRHSYSYNLLAKDGQIDNGDLLVTARKLVSKKVFGADKYLRWGCVLHNEELRSSDQRTEVLKRLSRDLDDLQCNRRYISQLVNVADEFLTNAFYHGPTDPTGTVHLYSGRNRADVVTLPHENRVTFEYGSDGRYVAIAVRDRFGSFDPQLMLQKFANCVGRKLVPAQGAAGGAGIGLFLTHRSVNQLVINLHPGFACEFIAIMDVSIPNREQMTAPRSINVFTVS